MIIDYASQKFRLGRFKKRNGFAVAQSTVELQKLKIFNYVQTVVNDQHCALVTAIAIGHQNWSDTGFVYNFCNTRYMYIDKSESLEAP